MEHRLAEERPAERHAVQPARQLALPPCFDRVRQAQAVERDVAVDDLLGDPGARIVRIAIDFRAGMHHVREGAIDDDLEAALTPDSREASGDREVLERNDAARIGREPADLAPFDCHREPSARVGGDQELRFDHQTSAPLSRRDPRPFGVLSRAAHVLRYLSSPEITEMLAAWLPASIRALQDYSARSFWHDVVAGVTVGLVALPLAMAFAIASGLTPQAGIYCAIVTGFTISALGGSRVQIGGPTGAFVVVVAGIVAKYGVGGLFMCTMMAGVMLVILGVTGMGTAVKFIPRPVVIGFTNGIAVLIASTQIRDFLGLRIDRVPAEFLAAPRGARADISTPSTAAAAILGAVALAAIVVLRRTVPAIPGAIVALVAGTAAVMALGLPGRNDREPVRRHSRRVSSTALSGVPRGAHPDADPAGADGRDARRDRVADVGGRRRSDERRSAQSERRARRAGHREHRVARVRRPAGDRSDRADGDEHPLGRADARGRAWCTPSRC